MKNSVFYGILNKKNMKNICPKKLKKIRRFFRTINIYVIRVSGSNLNMSKPCGDCLSKMKILGINRVFYSEDQYNIVEEKVKNMNSEHMCLASKLNFVGQYYK